VNATALNRWSPRFSERRQQRMCVAPIRAELVLGGSLSRRYAGAIMSWESWPSTIGCQGGDRQVSGARITWSSP